MRKTVAIILSVLICLSATGITANAAETAVPMPEIKEYGFVTASDGIQIEYGIYGDENAQPLLLLPCNGADMNGFNGNVLPEMAKHYRVITVSPRGTGRSGRGDCKLTFEVESDDLVVLLDTLGIEKTYVYGFSDGGNLGVVFTLREPERVEKLSIMGANINTFGTKPWNQLSIELNYLWLSIQYFFTKDETIALRRDIEGMMVGQPKLTFSDLKAIQIPVFNIYGEHDMIQRWHSKKITASIDGATELMIVDGGHSSCFEYTDTVINPALLEFFGE